MKQFEAAIPQPISEISTDRLLDEIVSRAGGLTSMQERVKKEFAKRLMSNVRGESEETVFSVVGEDDEKCNPKV